MADHETNMKDPVWLTEQMTRYKAMLAELQGKHDAQLAGIADDKKTIASLQDALAVLKEQAATLQASLAQEQHNREAERIQAAEKIKQLTGNLELAKQAAADQLAQTNATQALAKSRRTALAEVMKIISPVLAGE